MTKPKAKAPASTPRKRARKQASAQDQSEVKAALQSQSGIKRKTRSAMLPETMVIPGRGREGLKGVVIYLNEAAKSQLSKLAIDEHKTVQELGVESINLLFRSYRLKPIA